MVESAAPVAEAFAAGVAPYASFEDMPAVEAKVGAATKARRAPQTTAEGRRAKPVARAQPPERRGRMG